MENANDQKINVLNYQHGWLSLLQPATQVLDILNWILGIPNWIETTITVTAHQRLDNLHLYHNLYTIPSSFNVTNKLIQMLAACSAKQQLKLH